MKNYILYTPKLPQRRSDGTFNKGHTPFNKGVPMSEWMDGRKIRKVMKCLEIGRKGHKHLPGCNRIAIVGIKDGKLYPFRSATDAEKILRKKGIKVSKRNIRSVCDEKANKNKRNGKYYIRKTAGGFRWFNADDVEKYKYLIK